MPVLNATFEELERLRYSEGATEAAQLLHKLDELERDKEELKDLVEDLLPVRYFLVEHGDDGAELIEVRRFEWEIAKGSITYERHTISENGCNQICLTKGLDQ